MYIHVDVNHSKSWLSSFSFRSIDEKVNFTHYKFVGPILTLNTFAVVHTPNIQGYDRYSCAHSKHPGLGQIQLCTLQTSRVMTDI